MAMLQQIHKGLVVSCQALPHAPLHSSLIMSRLAVAAEQGGAEGIRANTKEDILAIKQACSLGVIGIVKRDYEDSDVFITATTREIDELLDSGCEMIALDATNRARPNGQTLEQLVQCARARNAHVLLMVDIATVDGVVYTQQLGFDCVTTMLFVYTAAIEGKNLYEYDFKLLKDVLVAGSIPVIAE